MPVITTLDHPDIFRITTINLRGSKEFHFQLYVAADIHDIEFIIMGAVQTNEIPYFAVQQFGMPITVYYDFIATSDELVTLIKLMT